jgi:hypothetical protein
VNKPLLVEILAYAPTAFYHCMHCEVAFREMGKSDAVQKEQLSSSLPSDLMDEYRVLSDWVREMFRHHRDRLVINVIDAASVEGVIRSLRYGAHRFPAVIIAKRGRFAGEDALALAADEIQRRLDDPSFLASTA